MADGLYNELTQTGQLIRNAIVSPIETRIRADQMKRQQDLQDEEVAYTRKKRAARELVGPELEKTDKKYGGLMKKMYDAGESGQSAVAMRNSLIRGNQEKTGKAGKPDWFTKMKVFEDISNQFNEQLALANKAVLDAPDNESRTAAMQKAAALQKSGEELNLFLANQNKDLQAAVTMKKFAEFGAKRDAYTPENLENAANVAETVLQNQFGVSGDVMEALKDTEKTLGVKLDTKGVMPANEIAKMYLAAQASPWPGKKVAKEEALAIMNEDDEDKLAEITKDTDIPMPGRVLAATLLSNKTAIGALTKSTAEAVKGKSLSEVKAIATSKPKSYAGRKAKSEAFARIEKEVAPKILRRRKLGRGGYLE